MSKAEKISEEVAALWIADALLEAAIKTDDGDELKVYMEGAQERIKDVLSRKKAIADERRWR